MACIQCCSAWESIALVDRDDGREYELFHTCCVQLYSRAQQQPGPLGRPPIANNFRRDQRNRKRSAAPQCPVVVTCAGSGESCWLRKEARAFLTRSSAAHSTQTKSPEASQDYHPIYISSPSSHLPTHQPQWPSPASPRPRSAAPWPATPPSTVPAPTPARPP